MGLAVGDYLHTGRPALAVTDFSMDNTALYRNDGNWDFQEISYAAGVGLPSVRGRSGALRLWIWITTVGWTW